MKTTNAKIKKTWQVWYELSTSLSWRCHRDNSFSASLSFKKIFFSLSFKLLPYLFIFTYCIVVRKRKPKVLSPSPKEKPIYLSTRFLKQALVNFIRSSVMVEWGLTDVYPKITLIKLEKSKGFAYSIIDFWSFFVLLYQLSEILTFINPYHYILFLIVSVYIEIQREKFRLFKRKISLFSKLC